jgi:hypothetical protein
MDGATVGTMLGTADGSQVGKEEGRALSHTGEMDVDTIGEGMDGNVAGTAVG